MKSIWYVMLYLVGVERFIKCCILLQRAYPIYLLCLLINVYYHNNFATTATEHLDLIWFVSLIVITLLYTYCNAETFSTRSEIMKRSESSYQWLKSDGEIFIAYILVRALQVTSLNILSLTMTSYFTKDTCDENRMCCAYGVFICVYTYNIYQLVWGAPYAIN